MAFSYSQNRWQLIQAECAWPLDDFVKNQEHAFYLYDLGDARMRAREFLKSRARVHFAMKANSHPRLLKMLAGEGLGVDVVSLGEMQKALRCGFAPQKVIFSGLGKGRAELESACRERIFQINVESFEELRLLDSVAREIKYQAPVALRVNIHLDAPTHKNIQTATEESKFGIDIRQLGEVLAWVKKSSSLSFRGFAVHVGSQIMDVSVFSAVSRKMAELYEMGRTMGFQVTTLDVGGGLGLDYKTDGASDLGRLPAYFQAVRESLPKDIELILEPGRFLVARMGVLCAKVIHVKQGINRRFVILNAGMNALMRPALYQAYHRIELISRPGEGAKERYCVVGPLCESTDVFADDREIYTLQPGDWVGIFDAGAYGAVMANTYNEMNRPAEWSILDGQLEVL